MPATQGTLGVRPDAVWLRAPLAVAPGSDRRWILDIDYAPINRIDVALATGGRIVQQAVLGNTQPFSQRPLLSRSHTMVLNLEPGARYELLLRVQAELNAQLEALPEPNRGSFEELPDYLKEGITVHFAKRFADVAKVLF